MHGGRESDPSIVPRMRPNHVRRPRQTHTAEAVEGRAWAQGQTVEPPRGRSPRRSALQHARDRLRAAVRRDRTAPLTALWHPVSDPEGLREASDGLHRDAAPGIDGQTWTASGAYLEENLRELAERLKRGASHASPVERVYIPQAEGRQRPIGKPTLADTIVQRAPGEGLNAL